MRYLIPLIIFIIGILQPLTVYSYNGTVSNEATKLPGYILALNISITRFKEFLALHGILNTYYVNTSERMLYKSIELYREGKVNESRLYALRGFKYLQMAIVNVKREGIISNKTIPREVVVKIIINRTYHRLISFINKIEGSGLMCNIRNFTVEGGGINESRLLELRHQIYWCMSEFYKEFAVRHMMPDLGKLKLGHRYHINWAYRPIHGFKKRFYNTSTYIVLKTRASIRILKALEVLYSMKGNKTAMKLISVAIEELEKGNVESARKIISGLGVVGNDWVSNNIRVYLMIIRNILQ